MKKLLHQFTLKITADVVSEVVSWILAALVGFTLVHGCISVFNSLFN